jgi:hypothetical protein
MSFGPLLTARKESVCRATRRSPSARSAQPAVAMRHSEEKTTWVAMRNNGSSTTVRLSASSTMRRPRRRAAAQIGPTKTGYRLSASTMSAAAVSASGSDGMTAATRSSRWVTMVRSPRASMKIADSAVANPGTR